MLIFAIISSLAGCSILPGAHDLSGVYVYDGMFPITVIRFQTDGSFEARCDYYEYSTGAIYYGSYSKSGDVYNIRFEGAETSSGNAVTNFKDETFGYEFEMSAKVLDEDRIAIWVSGGNSYYPWMNSRPVFTAGYW